MNSVTSSTNRHALGFSLPEVTMALAIVSAVTLPMLALLAGSGSMQGSAQDHERAAQIAHTLANSIRASETHSHLHLLTRGRDHLTLPVVPSDGIQSYLAFDLEGRFLSEISEERFMTGLRGDARAHHLVRLRLHPSDRGTQLEDTLSDLYQLEISVGQPAIAEQTARSQYRFHTSILAP